MSWETVLKKKKINMDGLKKIIKHILDNFNPKQFAITSLVELVVPVYLKYNQHLDAISSGRTGGTPFERRIGGIISNVVKNMGYSAVAQDSKGGTREFVARDYLIMGKRKGAFLLKDGENFEPIR